MTSFSRNSDVLLLKIRTRSSLMLKSAKILKDLGISCLSVIIGFGLYFVGEVSTFAAFLAYLYLYNNRLPPSEDIWKRFVSCITKVLYLLSVLQIVRNIILLSLLCEFFNASSRKFLNSLIDFALTISAERSFHVCMMW